MPKWLWIERKFSFDYPPAKMPDLLERVRGTPARLEERVGGLSRDALTGSDGKGWSIQENIGHLRDLEDLHLARIDEILSGAAVLTAADMTNRRTVVANHNARPIEELLAEFRRERMRLVVRFEQVGEAAWGRSALHPRLKQPMRIVDIAFFTAEHDDYHLGRIGALIRFLTDASRTYSP